MNFVAIPFFSFSQAGPAGSAGFSYFEIFVRKWVPVDAMGFFAVARRRACPSKNVFFGSNNFEVFGINAARCSAKVVEVPVFRNRLSEHQAGDTVAFPFDLDSGISIREIPSPKPAPAVRLYFIFFLKHLLSISAFL